VRESDLGQGGYSALADGITLARCLSEAILLGGDTGEEKIEDCRLPLAAFPSRPTHTRPLPLSTALVAHTVRLAPLHTSLIPAVLSLTVRGRQDPHAVAGKGGV
jgi:hypothetical protein